MRIIHTSDWHLGQYFYTKSRATEHRAFLQWLIQCIKEYNVDAVIVAGDIFDTSTPPSYARELYNRFVVDIQSTGCQLIILAGNHDSVAVLNESSQLLSCLNTVVIAEPLDDLDSAIITLKNKQGQPAALLATVPFIRPRDLLTSQAGQTSSEKQQALIKAISDYYHTLFQRAEQQRYQENRCLPVIMTGHLTTVGASQSSSEREIYIGTLDAFPVTGFPAADYIALGHIHRSQIVGGNPAIRYSGSPIPLSFDEANQQKNVLLVEFADHNSSETVSSPQITPLAIPLFQPMALIKGSIDEISQQLRQYKQLPQTKTLPIWLDIEVVTSDYLPDIQRKIEMLTAELPVEVLLLRRSKVQQQVMLEQQVKETLTELSVYDVFARRLALEDGSLPSEQQQRLTTLFRQIVDEIQNQ